jgi:hypothetical protein
MLHQLARAYVLDGLAKGNFDAIPYTESVILRAPLCPGGVSQPLCGRKKLREEWWAPLPQLVAGVEILDTYVNRDLSAVAIEFFCHISQPACTLRIIDRFKVDADGRITEQENYFDPRDVTNPGWQSR